MEKAKVAVAVQGTLSINKDEQQAIIAFSAATEEARNKNQKLVETLYANGKRSFHFVGAKDEDKGLLKFRNSVLHYIVAGWDKEAQRLYSAEPKTLSVSEQATQTILKTKTAPITYANIKKAMQAFEKAAESGKTEKSTPKTPEQMVKKLMLDAIEKIQKLKNGYEGMLDDLVVLKKMNALKNVK